MTSPFRRRLINPGDPQDPMYVPPKPGPNHAEAEKIVREYYAKKADDLPPNPLDGLPARPRRHRALNSWEPGQHAERPAWQTVSTPEPVATAWQAVLAAVEAVTESSAAVKALGPDEAAERGRYDAEVVAAIEAGDKPPAPTAVTDRTAEKVKREAVDRVRQHQLRGARRAYDEAVQRSLYGRPGWVAWHWREPAETLPHWPRSGGQPAG